MPLRWPTCFHGNMELAIEFLQREQEKSQQSAPAENAEAPRPTIELSQLVLEWSSRVLAAEAVHQLKNLPV